MGEQIDQHETGQTLATKIAEFVANTNAEDIPEEVLERARHLVLDSVGLAFASTAYPFSQVARDALGKFGGGHHPVLGMKDRLEPRDAAVLNGVLIHGLDFDDTHIPAVTHVSSAALPAALAAAVGRGERDGSELLAAYVLGVEVSSRVGMAGAGRFHDVGWHPTSVAGAFGGSVAAGKLGGLAARELAAAQGIVGSMSGGLLEFLEDGSWTKRLHAGWAAMCGYSAANFAGTGWSGPSAVYEGRFGLFATHLGSESARPEALVDGLGQTWELTRTAVKPYPVCHFIHAFADAALVLRAENTFDLADIGRIRCAIHPTPGKVVSEPMEAKWAPKDEYDAKFSLPYVVATALTRQTFTLAELGDPALEDRQVLDLARRVEVVEDTNSAFPRAYSGAIEIELTSGRRLSRREQVNRGHEERPLTNDEIVSKFNESMAVVADTTTTNRVRESVLGLGDGTSANEFVEACRAA